MDFNTSIGKRACASEAMTLGQGRPWRVTCYGTTWYIINVETKKGKKIGPVSRTGRGVNYFDRAKQEAEKRNGTL